MSKRGNDWHEWYNCNRYTSNRSLAATEPKLRALRISVVRTLQRGLKDFPLKNAAFNLEAAGFKYNVSPYFMAAAAGVESTFGRAPCFENPRNVWGLGACNGVWTVPYFDSWKEAAHYYASFLKRTWKKATTAYHYYGYSACDSCWGRKVAYYMQYYFNSGPATAYPR